MKSPSMTLLLVALALSACGAVDDDGDTPDESGSPSGNGSCMAIADSAPAVCSMLGEARIVTFKNDCPEAVEIWWVTYSCSERFVVRLDPGASHRENSFVSHPWRVRAAPATGAPGAMKGALIKDLGPTPAGTGDYAFSVP